jgi:hypothetical protein
MIGSELFVKRLYGAVRLGWSSRPDKEALPKIFLESLRIQLLVVSLLQTSVVVQPQMLSKTRENLQVSI